MEPWPCGRLASSLRDGQSARRRRLRRTLQIGALVAQRVGLHNRRGAVRSLLRLAGAVHRANARSLLFGRVVLDEAGIAGGGVKERLVAAELRHAADFTEVYDAIDPRQKVQCVCCELGRSD